MSERRKAGRKLRLASKSAFLYAVLYDIHRRAVQIRDLLKLMGCEEVIIWRVLSNYVSETMQKLPARRLSWWKDDSYPPAAIEMDVIKWRQLPCEYKELYQEAAEEIAGLFGLAPIGGNHTSETITNDM